MPIPLARIDTFKAFPGINAIQFLLSIDRSTLIISIGATKKEVQHNLCDLLMVFSDSRVFEISSLNETFISVAIFGSRN